MNEMNLLRSSVLDEINEILRADGAALVVRTSTPTSLHLELDLSRSSCPECVVSRELMTEILETRLREAEPDIREVELTDPREVLGPHGRAGLP